MQIQKESVRNSILQAAEESLFSWGYQHTSLRQIANSANITVGNIYRYFENKEALFWAVVEPAWEDIKQIIQNQEDSYEKWDTDHIQQLAANLTRVFLARQKQFMILMSNEIGAPNTGVREDVEILICERLSLDLLPALPSDKQDPLIMEILASAIAASMFKVFREYNGDVRMLTERVSRIIHIFLGDVKDWK